MFPRADEQQPKAYEPPRVTDLGSLAEMTQACFGTGAQDESFKGGDYGFSSPFFGDGSFCTPSV